MKKIRIRITIALMRFQTQRKHRQGELQIINLDKLMEMIRAKVEGKFDMVVGIERGGILPAYLASRWLDVPLKAIRIPSQDENHLTQNRQSHLEHSWMADIRGMRVLLVDDVVNTGATLRRAAQELAGAEITSMTISGEADISLFGPHEKCIRWPWEK